MSKHVLALAILLVGSLLVNLQYYRIATNLQNRISQSKSTPQGFTLRTGDSVPPLAMRKMDGTETSVTFESSELPTVVYVFTPQCQWCTANLDNLRVVAESTKSRYRIVGVSLQKQGLPEYVTSNAFTFPVFMEPTRETNKAYGFGATPMTVIVDSKGVVQQVWKGAYADDVAAEVETALGLKLPGLRVASKIPAP